MWRFALVGGCGTPVAILGVLFNSFILVVFGQRHRLKVNKHLSALYSCSSRKLLAKVFLCKALTCTILCFVLVLGKTKTKLFLLLQWYFNLSKQKVFVLIFVLPKPKQNRAGQTRRLEWVKVETRYNAVLSSSFAHESNEKKRLETLVEMPLPGSHFLPYRHGRPRRVNLPSLPHDHELRCLHVLLQQRGEQLQW